VLLAALLATGANYLSLKAYFEWNFENSDCREKQLGEIAMDRLGESALKSSLESGKLQKRTTKFGTRQSGQKDGHPVSPIVSKRQSTWGHFIVL
jgi:hypothetical protein